MLDEARQTAQAILDGDPTLEIIPTWRSVWKPSAAADRIGTPQLMARPWHPIPIHDNGEPLLAIPLPCCAGSPIPTKPLVPLSRRQQSVSVAPKRGGTSTACQQVLRDQAEPLQLLIFDAFRPLAVQQFMVDHTRAQPGVTEEDVMALWAEPSADPTTPPPHSTGAAVDLTLATPQGEPLDMGGEIDAVGPIGHPNHFADADPASAEGVITSGAASCITPWTQLGLSGTPRSGGISAGAISSGLGAAGCLRPLRPQFSGLKHGLKLLTKGMAVIAETFLGGLLLPLAEQRAQGGFHLSQRHLLQHGPCQAG